MGAFQREESLIAAADLAVAERSVGRSGGSRHARLDPRTVEPVRCRVDVELSKGWSARHYVENKRDWRVVVWPDEV